MVLSSSIGGGTGSPAAAAGRSASILSSALLRMAVALASTPLRAEAVAETRDTIGAQARRVLAQVAVERGRVGQRVLHAQCDPRRRRRWFQHFQDARAGEAGQREDLGDMCVQPAPVFRGDAGIDVEVDLVHDHRRPLSGTAHAHTRLPSTVSATPIDSRIT
jgi:hypothetical protein